ncbi:MAG: uracil-DNA glycosylase family protein [Gammaproteobacteria bacterium]
MPSEFEKTIAEARGCTACTSRLPLVPRPVFQLDPKARILVAGQAPGRKAHDTGVPFNDPSGKRLRDWMGLDAAVFCDAEKVAVLPMGFCYPGKGSGGDLPPRPECAGIWRERLLQWLPEIRLTLLVGRYAQAWHLKYAGADVTENVRHWRDFWPQMLPMPHPSPRNVRWLKQNPWFETEVLPVLKHRIAEILALR